MLEVMWDLPVEMRLGLWTKFTSSAFSRGMSAIILKNFVLITSLSVRKSVISFAFSEKTN